MYSRFASTRSGVVAAVFVLISVHTVGAAVLAPQGAGSPEEPEDGQWLRAAKNFVSTRYRQLDQTKTAKVDQLKVAWTFSTGTDDGHEAAPIVTGSTMSPLRHGLWIGMLGPPLIWFVQFQIKYSLAARTALPSRAVVIGTSMVAVIAVPVCGLIASRCHRLAAASPLDQFAGKVQRTRFMATLGIWSSGFFLLLVVALPLADLFIKPGLQ